jgi:hypothetical protein
MGDYLGVENMTPMTAAMIVAAAANMAMSRVLLNA